ncbi:MAG: DUF1501 domain-containing protein, partial [Myxococcota bacterium]
TRRSVLAGALASAGVVGVGGRGMVARAAPPPVRNLVVVFAYGGWDATFGIGPVEDPQSPLPPGKIRRFGEIDGYVADDYPAFGRFLEAWGPQAHVVRGLSVRSVSHFAAARRAVTGSPDPSRPDVAAITGVERGGDRPVPYLVLGPHALTGTLGAHACAVGLTNQINDLTLDRPFDDADQAAIDAFLAGSDADRLGRTWGAAAQTRLGELALSRERARALIGRQLGVSGTEATLTDNVALAVEALGEGFTRAVELDANLAFDTHFSYVEQAPYLDALFVGVTDLVTRLSTTPSPDGAGRVLLDDTVVLVVSEFTRTPRLNLMGGTDHWPWAQLMVIGSGIRGGAVSGAVDTELAGVPTDLATGAPTDAGSTLRVENFLAGLLGHLGVDAGAWLVDEPLVSPFAG